jgi:hypothetical protein
MTSWNGVVLVAVGLTASAAWPCSGPPCSALIESVPRNGATIPANTPAIGVGPAAPFPTTAATIAFLDSRWFPDAGATSCGASPEVQLARLRVTPTPDMEPWLALVRWELEVDGRFAGAAPYGTIAAGPYEPEATLGPQFLPINIVPIACQGGGIAPGLHQVRLLARLEGLATPIASNTLSLQIDCVPGGSPDAGPVPQRDGGLAPVAGVDGGDGGATVEPDAGRDGGGPMQPIVIDGGSGVVSGPVPPAGCSVSTAGAALMLLVLPLSWSRRRRRA